MSETKDVFAQFERDKTFFDAIPRNERRSLIRQVRQFWALAEKLVEVPPAEAKKDESPTEEGTSNEAPDATV